MLLQAIDPVWVTSALCAMCFVSRRVLCRSKAVVHLYGTQSTVAVEAWTLYRDQHHGQVRQAYPVYWTITVASIPKQYAI